MDEVKEKKPEIIPRILCVFLQSNCVRAGRQKSVPGRWFSFHFGLDVPGLDPSFILSVDIKELTHSG